MNYRSLPALTLVAFTVSLVAQTPENLVVEGLALPGEELKREVGRYLEFRAAAFADWHPRRREMVVATRFAETPQLHLVTHPGGDRRQITFLPEPVAGGTFDPQAGEFLVFLQDNGGGEFYQLYRLDFADGRIHLLTDGKSRNTGVRWSRGGTQFAYTSTRRNGRDNDIYVMDPRVPGSDRLVAQVPGGGWSVMDWSPDDARLLVGEYISINESRLHVCDVRTSKLDRVTPATAEKVAWGGGMFARDGRSLFVVSDQDSEFQRLGRLELSSAKFTPFAASPRADVEDFDLSDDGKRLAFVSNDEGASRLHLLDASSGRELRAPQLPLGVISGLKWSANNRDLAFSLSAAKSPNDVYSLDAKTGKVERWTQSETGGLNPEQFVEPELIRLKSFDGLEISGFLYRPDPSKYSGPRPLLISIHGGPEAQSRPGFQARNNYFLNELGVAVLYPNVRGSAGYGKSFLALDNGFKREDTVKDIGAFLDWVTRDGRLDAKRVAVYGGSYGGYMSLASMIHFNQRLRCGIDVVGISSFLTFLKNTQDYRRDLRRVEYGDERDPAMAEFLAKISPLNQPHRINRPLFVVQGLNDPRVPATESEQMVKAIRERGGKVSFLMAKDEGHGFQKKRNVDFLFASMVAFLKENLLE